MPPASEPTAVMIPVRTATADAADAAQDKVDEVKGTRETRIRGDNVSEYRKRVQRIGGDTS